MAGGIVMRRFLSARGTLLARASQRGPLRLPHRRACSSHRRACSQAGWRRQTSRGSATNKQTKKKKKQQQQHSPANPVSYAGFE